MWNKIANFILKNRFFVLGLIILATVFLGYYAITSLKMENKYGIVLPKDSPTTRNYNLFKEKFGEDGVFCHGWRNAKKLLTNQLWLN